jgi:glycosyltransferase involved in cell wall biosynthesis
MLSYVISTKNKLPYLKIAIEQLLRYTDKDEEIIIIDGNSTDGTAEYIKDLREQGKISMFLSEEDKGEAHGLNKGMMMATKPLIKIISDDDAFNFAAIKKCKKYMLENPDIDVMASDGAATSIANPDLIKDLQFFNNYLTWKKEMRPFAFCGLGLMIRKKAIPFVGLLNTSYIGVDGEFSMRITSMKRVKLAWLTGRNWIRITNPNSNGINYRHRIAFEMYKLYSFYSPGRLAAYAGYSKYVISYFKAYLLKLYAVKNPVPEDAFLKAYRNQYDAINQTEMSGFIAPEH